MKLVLCNEVVRTLTFEQQCAFAAAVSYDAIELAPFTLGEEPHLMADADRRAVRATAEAAGLQIVSLHWLLVTPKGLSITSGDRTVRERTVEVMRRLVGLCADLGGTVMVHGSPGQRRLEAGEEADGRKRARDAFAAVAEAAAKAGVTYCIEALAPRETNFVNTIAEAAALVDEIDSPALKTMLDCSAAGLSEDADVPALLDRWLPTGKLAHIQVNDPNQRGPGEGDMQFAPIFATLQRHGYDGAVAVEPFVYEPDGPTAAARAIGYLRGILEALR